MNHILFFAAADSIGVVILVSGFHVVLTDSETIYLFVIVYLQGLCGRLVRNARVLDVSLELHCTKTVHTC